MPSLGKLTRFARIFYRWQIRKAVVLDYLPEEVSIEATNVCNFKCAFCPQSDPSHHQKIPRSYLAAATAEKLLRKLRDGGVKTRVLHWTLDGEPFMNKDFPQLCAIALKWDFDNIYFATNGMLLTPADNEPPAYRDPARSTPSARFCRRDQRNISKQVRARSSISFLAPNCRQHRLPSSPRIGPMCASKSRTSAPIGLMIRQT